MMKLRSDRRGAIAVVFAISLMLLITALGAGLDLMNAYGEQQKLTQVAAMACQYAVRPSVIATASPDYAGSGSTATYLANVQTFATDALHAQFASNSPSYNATPTISGTPGELTSISFTSSVTTSFMQVAGFSSVPIAATSNCYSTTAPPQVNNNNLLTKETFANNLTNWVAYIGPSGGQVYTNGAGTIPVNNTFPAKPGYTGADGAQWYIMGYCLELDATNAINANTPGSGFSAELDCDNGNGSGGNSSISTQIYLEAGNYELRYFYTGRVDYPNYDPVTICGSSASDLSWANDSKTSAAWAGGSAASGSRSNQINVYLDLPLSTGAPPTHTTLDGTQTLAGSNLIDQCVYSPPNGPGLDDNAVWVERSVRIYVLTPGYFWLSFAADGHNDSFGGQIDDIRFCQGTCDGTVQDNFPSVSYNPYYPGGRLNQTASLFLPDWLNPNGANAGLFTETFESPTRTATDYHYNWDTNDTLYSSHGTSGSFSSGWPALAASGWGVNPINQLEYILSPDYETQHYTRLGSQYVDLFGQNSYYGAGGFSRLIARPFLLVPGFYNLSYDYISNFVFSGITGPTCLSWTGTAGPTAASLNAIHYYSTTYNSNMFAGTFFVNSVTSGSRARGVNTVGVYMANGQLASTPVISTAANSVYTNPDTILSDIPPVTSTSTVPLYAPDAISSGSYTASTTSALLDICTFSAAPTTRSINFQIQKLGYYWPTFSTQIAYPHTGGAGGAIDNVVLSALGSLAMTSPPANYVPVPVGSPQPGVASYAADRSFYIIADPPTYPAAMQ
jgi:Flp pilus assembly protein TadG